MDTNPPPENQPTLRFSVAIRFAGRVRVSRLIMQTEIAQRYGRSIDRIRQCVRHRDFPAVAEVGGPRGKTKFYRVADVERWWRNRKDGRRS
jgi:hypothetical protein